MNEPKEKQWLTWLKLLPMDISLSNIVMPTYPVQEGDKIVGVLQDDMQQLYSLGKSYARRNDEMNIHLAYDEFTQQEDKEAFKCRILSDTLNSLFWYAVRDEYDLWQSEELAVRKGFYIVIVGG